MSEWDDFRPDVEFAVARAKARDEQSRPSELAAPAGSVIKRDNYQVDMSVQYYHVPCSTCQHRTTSLNDKGCPCRTCIHYLD